MRKKIQFGFIEGGLLVASGFVDGFVAAVPHWIWFITVPVGVAFGVILYLPEIKSIALRRSLFGRSRFKALAPLIEELIKMVNPKEDVYGPYHHTKKIELMGQLKGLGIPYPKLLEDKPGQHIIFLMLLHAHATRGNLSEARGLHERVQEKLST